MKWKPAKVQPNSPAVYSNWPGLVSGDATMNATIGAQGMDVASMPSTRAIVPHEHSGVATPSPMAPTTEARWYRASHARSRSGLT
jgi:hypothetical protein